MKNYCDFLCNISLVRKTAIIKPHFEEDSGLHAQDLFTTSDFARKGVECEPIWAPISGSFSKGMKSVDIYQI